jgi:chemotaxis protein CheZ
MNTVAPTSVMEPSALPQDRAAAASELFDQLGLITRRLQDTLGQIDAMPKLRASAQGLPDARNRLGDIARKTGEAADKVLTAVELAKHERARITAAAAALARVCNGGGAGFDRRVLQRPLAEIDGAAARIDAYLTDIMVAQDFHDLTGQLVARIVTVAIELEDGLLQLLAHRAPGGPPPTPAGAGEAKSQREVDELLSSLGY